jgi:hypothetical protein
MARGVQIIEQDSGDMPSDQLSLATRLPEGQMMVSERTLFGDVITAQPIRAPRNEGNVLRKIEQRASAEGGAWYYRFPVKRKDGGTDFIEGPSIECTDAVGRWYGNCQVASAVQDVGAAWIIHSRFVDLETGYTLIRPFLQSKAGSRLGGVDDERRIQIAMGIGVSKSQRNVVVHALRDFCDRAFAAAKKNMVERIGRNLPEAKKRCIDKLNELDPTLLARVEKVYARKQDAWLAPDVARLVAEIQSVADGMADAREVWPIEPPSEPRRSDVVDQPAGAGGDPPQRPSDAEPGPAAASEVQPASSPPVSDEPLVKDWRVPEGTLGQDAIIDALEGMAGIAETEAELDEIQNVNSERIGRITGTKRAALNQMFAAQRLQIQQAASKP